MSIASDLRAYADSAVDQGKHTLSNAQASLNDIAGKANDAVSDLRASAERAINIDALRAAIEPYLAQVKGYGTTVTDRADTLLGDLKSDPRFAKVVGVSGVVMETVQERVVKPVQSMTGLGAQRSTPPAPKASTSATKPAPKPTARKTATTKPATTTATKSASTGTTARKTTAKRTAPKA